MRWVFWLQLAAATAKSAYCPTMECVDYVQEARWTGRFAIVVSGHIRVVHDQVPTIRAIVELNRPHTVDVFYHVWHNRTSQCESLSLAELRSVATVIVTEPIECMHSYGNGWENQWRMVDAAFATLERHRALSAYTLLVKTRADIIYHTPLNLTALWQRWEGRATAWGRNFIVLAAQTKSLDKQAIGTPSVVRAFTRYRSEEGLGCDSVMDRFAAARLQRYGAWPPPGAQTDEELRFRRFGDRARPPRCAAVFAEKLDDARVARARPHHMMVQGQPVVNDNQHPEWGCLSETLQGRRRLSAWRPPPGWVMPPLIFCENHTQDIWWSRDEDRDRAL